MRPKSTYLYPLDLFPKGANLSPWSINFLDYRKCILHSANKGSRSDSWFKKVWSAWRNICARRFENFISDSWCKFAPRGSRFVFFREKSIKSVLLGHKLASFGKKSRGYKYVPLGHIYVPLSFTDSRFKFSHTINNNNVPFMNYKILIDFPNRVFCSYPSHIICMWLSCFHTCILQHGQKRGRLLFIEH